MPTQSHPRLSWTRRLIILIATLASAFGLSVATGTAAHASVYGACHISGCSAAASADSTWASMGYPTQRGWYDWPNGQCSYAGGEYYNDDYQLPAGDTYYEYDVYPRSCGAHRDAVRIVVDFSTGEVWYSPDHYSDFYVL